MSMSGSAVERIFGAVLFLAGSGCGIASSVVLRDMVEDVNKVSPGAEQENPMGWYFRKWRRVIRKYHMLCPDGTRAEHSLG